MLSILKNRRFQRSSCRYSCLTGEAEHRFKVAALGDAGAVLGAAVPQVLELSVGGEDAAVHGGNLPVVVGQ